MRHHPPSTPPRAAPWRRSAPALLATLVAGCTAPPLPGELVARLQDAGGAARIELAGGRATWSVPVAPAELPPRARRTIEFVQPGGADPLVMLAIAPDGGRTYTAEGRFEDGVRTVTVDGDGNVRRRTHRLDPAVVPPAVLAVLARPGEPRPAAIEAVQEDGREGYRARFVRGGRLTRLREHWPDTGDTIDVRIGTAELRLR